MSYKDNPNKNTMDIYRDVVQIEVRALAQRVSELASATNSVFEEISTIAFSLDVATERIQKLEAAIAQCKQGIHSIKQTIKDYDRTVGSMMAKLCLLEQHTSQTKPPSRS